MTGWSQKTSFSIAVVFIDLSKAFDAVNQQKLPLFLESYGLGSTVLSLFHNYLDQVVIDAEPSSFLWVNKGTCTTMKCAWSAVFQCTVVIADILKIVSTFGAKLPSFADDPMLYLSKESLAVTCSTLLCKLDEIADSLAEKDLQFNMKKPTDSLAEKGLQVNTKNHQYMLICPKTKASRMT